MTREVCLVGWMVGIEDSDGETEDDSVRSIYLFLDT